MKQKIKRLLQKRPLRHKEPEESLEQAIQNIPRITNETVAEHREEVLSSARKFIYPLQHSARKVVMISITMFSVLALAFLTYCLLALYKFNTTSTFIYRVTQVIPFPVAKAGSDYVSYENYLFELRHYIHYYETQQKVDFNGDSGKQQLAAFREVALQGVINDAYIKQLAKEHHITVSDQEVRTQVELLRSQNRLGSSDAVFQDVLKEFWGWSVSDFERELKGQILAQKVVSALDTSAHTRAQEILTALQAGDDFARLAKAYSDDPSTRDTAGDYSIAIDKSNRDLAPQVVDTLFRMTAGQTSGIVETPIGLEILRLREVEGNRVRASHIFFAFKPVSTYVDPIKAKEKPRQYIHP